MSHSINTILMHGSDVIKYAFLPIELLSEETQESCNKDYKNFRENNICKISRLSTNTDLMQCY